ncbi:MAG: hypothetical protein CMI16_03130 [Opitutaceae bacterium]|nr:hypothetical protein [Opitutaceae bacterium]
MFQCKDDDCCVVDDRPGKRIQTCEGWKRAVRNWAEHMGSCRQPRQCPRCSQMSRSLLLQRVAVHTASEHPACRPCVWSLLNLKHQPEPVRRYYLRMYPWLKQMAAEETAEERQEQPGPVELTSSE